MFAARVAGSLLAGLRLAFADFEYHKKGHTRPSAFAALRHFFAANRWRPAAV